MFDPQIVDLFFAHLEELEAIKLRLSDPERIQKNAEIQ
jgi:hypothetical protein